jgi:methionine synthase II (cobalamin-independent)
MSSVRPALKLLPACATTAIGSLPHTQSELALQMALQHDVPFLPQLPRADPAELMIPAALEGLPGMAFDSDGVCTVDLQAWAAKRDRFTLEIETALATGQLNAFEPTAVACRAFRPFLWEVENRKLPFAKVQLAGPATVRWVAKTSTGAPASDTPELDQQIFRLLLARALSLVKAVRRAAATPIIFLDEPGLYALDPRDARHLVVLKELQVMIVALQREGALVGLHCCSNTRWADLLGLGLDILSIDARLSLDAVLEEPGAFWNFLSGGSTLSLGIVPTDIATAYKLDELVDSVEASLRATAPKGIAFEAVLSQMLLTPACGLGMRSVLDAERIIGEVRQAQRAIRSLFASAAA